MMIVLMMKHMIVIKTTIFDDAKLKVPSTKILKQDADLTVQFKNHKIRVHKAVLIERCPYFKAMLNSNYQESNNDEVYLEDTVDFETFRLLVVYLYLGLIEISTENLEIVSQSANFFQLDNLKEFCASIFTQNPCFDTATVEYIHNFAKQHDLRAAVNAAFEFKVKHFELILKRGDFLPWPFESIKQVICSDLVVVTREKKVLQFVFEWLNFASIPHRALHTDDLLQSMKYTYLSHQDMVLSCSTRPELLQKCYKNKKEFSGKTTPPRQHHKGVYIYGVDRFGGKKFQRYWPIDGSVKDLKPPKLDLENAQCVVQKERIYLLDDNLLGMSLKGVSCKLEMYDPLKDEWTSLAPMKCRHGDISSYEAVGICSHTCCGFEDEIYSFRTHPGEECISLAVYSISTNSWKYTKTTHKKKGHLGFEFSCTVGDSIYFNEYSIRGVEVVKFYQYKPSTEKFTEIPVPPSVHKKDVLLCKDKMLFYRFDRNVVVFDPISLESHFHILPSGWPTFSYAFTSFNGAVFGFSKDTCGRQDGKYEIEVWKINPLTCTGKLIMLSTPNLKTTMEQVLYVTSIE